MRDGGAFSPVSRLVYRALLYLAGDRTNTLRGSPAVGHDTATGQAPIKNRFTLHVIVWI